MKSPDLIPAWMLLAAGAAILCGVVLLAGCASLSQELVSHEERHCMGDAHQLGPPDGSPFRYEWQHVRPASIKPWVYIYVDDPDSICRARHVQGANRRDLHFDACATWHPKGCEIILPRN